MSAAPISACLSDRPLGFFAVDAAFVGESVTALCKYRVARCFTGIGQVFVQFMPNIWHKFFKMTMLLAIFFDT